MKLLRSLLIAALASALAACASPAPTTSSATGTSRVSAPATAAAGPRKANQPIPDGYKRVVVNGQERFCRTDMEPGSRVQKHTVCLTRNELDAQQDRNRDLMDNLSRQSGTYSGSRGNMGNMPMGGSY